MPEIKEATGCTVVGPKADRDRIPMIDVEVADGDTFMLFEAEAKVWDVPGHTAGHIAYWFAESRSLFCGDTLFALGCGRVFEGTFEQMYDLDFQVQRSARRNLGLLRPRIHDGQC